MENTSIGCAVKNQEANGKTYKSSPKISIQQAIDLHGQKITLRGTRTHNLWIRSPTRYPLRQQGLDNTLDRQFMKIYEIMRKRVTAYSCAYITYRGNFLGLTKEFLLLATLTLTLKYREYGTLLYFQKAELMLDSEIFKDGLLTRFVDVFSSGSSEEVARFFDSNYSS